MSDSRSRRGAVPALLTTLLLWAYSWVVMKQVLAYIGPFDFAALRYLFGALGLFAMLLLTRQPLRPPPLLATALIGLCQTAAFQGLEQWALVDGGAGHVALLAYTMPFWAVLLAWPLLAEQPSRGQWLGMALAGCGLVCILEPWHGLGSPRSTLLAIVGGMAWAAGTVLTKRLFQRHALTPMNLTAWQMLLGGLMLGAVALCVPQPPIRWTPSLIGGLAYSAVFASSIAWWLWLLALKRLPTAVASLSSLGVPVLTVLLAWLLMHERPTVMEGIGVLFILTGLFAVSGLRLPRNARSAPATR